MPGKRRKRRAFAEVEGAIHMQTPRVCRGVEVLANGAPGHRPACVCAAVAERILLPVRRHIRRAGEGLAGQTARAPRVCLGRGRYPHANAPPFGGTWKLWRTARLAVGRRAYARPWRRGFCCWSGGTSAAPKKDLPGKRRERRAFAWVEDAIRMQTPRRLARLRAWANRRRCSSRRRVRFHRWKRRRSTGAPRPCRPPCAAGGRRECR